MRTGRAKHHLRNMNCLTRLIECSAPHFLHHCLPLVIGGWWALLLISGSLQLPGIPGGIVTITRGQLDLCDQQATLGLFEIEAPRGDRDGRSQGWWDRRQSSNASRFSER